MEPNFSAAEIIIAELSKKAAMLKSLDKMLEAAIARAETTLKTIRSASN